MAGPFAEGSIVIEAETDEPSEYLQFDPDGLPGERWLHRPAEFDAGHSRAAVIDRYSLPESDVYRVRTVQVPAGVHLQLGDVAAMHGRSGGGDLVCLVDHETIPEEWIVDTETLTGVLE